MVPQDLGSTGPGVLVVEDTADVRQLLGFALPQLGSPVWLADGGREAVRLYQEHRQEIGVVLLDVRMPDLDGPATLAALQELDPAVRVVFMTGHTGPYTAEELLALGAARVLEKPFGSLVELARTLREVAQAQAPPPLTRVGFHSE
jgi:CheY-like chemotaxis protein